MKKHKTKIIYRTPKVPLENEEKKIKEEIEELETKKTKIAPGIRGVLMKFNLNKQIHDKRTFIQAGDRLRTAKRQIEVGKLMVEKEKIRAELNEQKKKSAVNFADLYKGL